MPLASAHGKRRGAHTTRGAHAGRSRRSRHDDCRRHRARILAPRGGVVMGTDDRHVAAATLASLPLITAPRLRRMLEAFGDPEVALAAVRAGRVARYIGHCDDIEPAELAAQWREFAEAN